MEKLFGPCVSITTCAQAICITSRMRRGSLPAFSSLVTQCRLSGSLAADDRVDQAGGLFLVQRFLVVAQHREFGLADAAIRNGVQRLALDVHLHQLQAIS